MSKELWDKGLAVRKEVLGAEYVERQLKTVDDFGMPMQELVTQSCWGWLWGRPQLPRKLRSLVNLGMLSALNRPNEFKTHVKGALTNGCTREEIREHISGNYCRCTGYHAIVDAIEEVIKTEVTHG